MKIVLLINIILVNLQVFAQGFDKNDSLAKSIPVSVTLNPDLFAKYLKDNFKSEEGIVRALYIWLATNVSYDLDKLDSIKLNPNKVYNENLIENTLKTKKGVCENYATVFSKICNLNGIKSYIITGYTKQFDNIETRYSHAWNIAKIDSIWYLFDPTWGAGFIRFERFHKKFNLQYYKSNPDSLIKTHMPFDPIWQLKDYPISHKDFILGTSTKNIKINYKDSIVKFFKLPEYLKIKTSFERSEIFEFNQPELLSLYSRNKEYSINFVNRYYVYQFNSAVSEYNDAGKLYNEYLKSTNIKSKKIKLIEVKEKIRVSKEYIANTSNTAIPQGKIDQLKNDISKFEKLIKSK